MHFHPDIFLFTALPSLIFGIVIWIIYSRVKNKPINPPLTETIKHLGQIPLGLGILLQLVESTIALDYLEHATNSPRSRYSPEALNQHLLGIHSVIVYLIAMAIFIILRLMEKKKTPWGQRMLKNGCQGQILAHGHLNNEMCRGIT